MPMDCIHAGPVDCPKNANHLQEVISNNAPLLALTAGGAGLRGGVGAVVLAGMTRSLISQPSCAQVMSCRDKCDMRWQEHVLPYCCVTLNMRCGLLCWLLAAAHLAVFDCVGA